jgi:hypothetical protein
MCLLWYKHWVFIYQVTVFFIVTAVKTSNLTQKYDCISIYTEVCPLWTTLKSPLNEILYVWILSGFVYCCDLFRLEDTLSCVVFAFISPMGSFDYVRNMCKDDFSSESQVKMLIWFKEQLLMIVSKFPACIEICFQEIFVRHKPNNPHSDCLMFRRNLLNFVTHFKECILY